MMCLRDNVVAGGGREMRAGGGLRQIFLRARRTRGGPFRDALRNGMARPREAS